MDSRKAPHGQNDSGRIVQSLEVFFTLQIKASRKWCLLCMKVYLLYYFNTLSEGSLKYVSLAMFQPKLCLVYV